MEPVVDNGARVQVWAKGFRITAGTLEYQLVAPHDEVDLLGFERVAMEFAWSDVMPALYRFTKDQLAAEFALLLDGQSSLLVVLAPSTDQSSRASLVGVCATVGVDWNSVSLDGCFARLHALARRLADAYSRSLAGAKDHVREQLKSGRFLANRSFALENEVASVDVDWVRVVREIRRWRGISGIATAGLIGLGGNVLYGTRDDFERSRQRAQLGAWFDPARGIIEPFGDLITPWAADPVPQKAPEPPSQPNPSLDELQQINANLRQLNRGMENLYDLWERFIATMLYGDRRDKRRGRD